MKTKDGNIVEKKESGMKRILVLVLAFACSISMLVGCGNDTKENESDVLQTESSSTELVGKAEIGNDESSSVGEKESVEKEDSAQSSTESSSTESGSTESGSTESSGKETSGAGTTSTGTEGTGTTNTGATDTGNSETVQKESTETGLDKESYDTMVNVPSSKNEKEVELAREIIKKIIKNDMSDFDKAKAINDYIILNVTYDQENYDKGTIPAKSYTALGALETKVAVCAGYAKMFQILANEAGLQATYVTGNTPYGYHAWNQVKVDGIWYNVDTTWNDTDCEKREGGHSYCGCYEYFLISNYEFESCHTPSTKVNPSGNTRNKEAAEKGCPYEKSSPYCKTQEDVDALVKEMLATNTMSKRIMVDTYLIKDMVVSSLKKHGIYGEEKVILKDELSIYLGRMYKITKVLKVTIEISLDGMTYEEAKLQRVTSIADAKKALEKRFKSYSAESGKDERYSIYMEESLYNLEFRAEMIRWANYEMKMNINFIQSHIQVDNGVYEFLCDYRPKKADESAREILTSVNDIESAIQRMFKYGYKKVFIQIYPTDYKITENTIATRPEFREKYCAPLNEKYCLKSDENIHVNENYISVSFASQGHNVEYQSWVVQKEATCVSDGLEVKICKICKKAGEERVIPKNDNHSYYWDQNGDIRVQRCSLCSYEGITELCYGGVWGYFDEVAAMEELDSINAERTRTPLVMDNALIEFAKERLAALNAADFTGGIENEYAIRYTPVSNFYKKKYAGSSKGVNYEGYDRVGIICFKFDVNGDASRFSNIFVREYGVAKYMKL